VPPLWRYAQEAAEFDQASLTQALHPGCKNVTKLTVELVIDFPPLFRQRVSVRLIN
jgi:hypothetical protein